MALGRPWKPEINLDQADIVMLPNNTVDISSETLAPRCCKLIDVLEDHDDVQKYTPTLTSRMRSWKK